MSEHVTDLAIAAYNRCRDEFLKLIAGRPDFIVGDVAGELDANALIAAFGSRAAGAPAEDRFAAEMATARVLTAEVFGEVRARAAETILREILYGELSDNPPDQLRESHPAARRAPPEATVRRRAIRNAMGEAMREVSELQRRISSLLARKDFLTTMGRIDLGLQTEMHTARLGLESVAEKFEAAARELPEHYRTDSQVTQIRAALDQLRSGLG